METFVFAGTGFLGPSTEDAVRIAILVVGIVTIIGIAAALLVLRHWVRLLLDVEQMTRESRNRLREQLERETAGLVRELGAIAGDLADLREMIKRGGRASQS